MNNPKVMDEVSKEILELNWSKKRNWHKDTKKGSGEEVDQGFRNKAFAQDMARNILIKLLDTILQENIMEVKERVPFSPCQSVVRGFSSGENKLKWF